MRRASIAVGVLIMLCSVVPFAQVTPAGNPMLGTWKLDPAKSRFSPGPALKSQIAKLAAVDGGLKVVVDRIDSDGTPTHFEWTAKFDGKDYPVKGDPGRDVVSVRKLDDYTLEITSKKAGRVTTTIRAVYAHDGKSRTETTTGTTPRGQKIENVTVWSKQ